MNDSADLERPDSLQFSPPATPRQTGTTIARWSQRWLLRSLLLYLVLFMLPMMVGVLAGFLMAPWEMEAVRQHMQSGGKPDEAPKSALDPIVSTITKAIEAYEEASKQAVLWVGPKLLSIEESKIPYQPTGSGDTMANYLEAAIRAVIALVLALVWSLIFRARPVSFPSRATVHWMLRWFLFFVMVPMYGFAKLIPQQFPEPGLQRLLLTWEESSPMGVLWRFMGLSPAYTVFSGACEVLGGVLLVWRRTTMLGALVVLSVMTNVLALNLCYDVPVKLHSAHYLVFALILLAPDARRLWRFFIRNQPTEAREFRPFLGSRWLDRAATVFKLLFLGWVVYLEIHSGRATLQSRAERQAPGLLHGIHDVQSVEVSGQTPDDAKSELQSWKTVVFDSKDFVQIQSQTLGFTMRRLAWDEGKQELKAYRIGKDATPEPEWTLGVTKTEDGQLLLQGEVGGKPHKISLKKRDLSQTTLRRHPFRWICEIPFNR